MLRPEKVLMRGYLTASSSLKFLESCLIFFPSLSVFLPLPFNYEVRDIIEDNKKELAAMPTLRGNYMKIYGKLKVFTFFRITAAK